ncbi:MAG: geranylgeranyl pyrophosphate synthase-like protein [Peptococcaceae bacterium]|nr:geranylgeranyl pyrophosphate synthase-like protein [Peptococcaceae bacterium]
MREEKLNYEKINIIYSLLYFNLINQGEETIHLFAIIEIGGVPMLEKIVLEFAPEIAVIQAKTQKAMQSKAGHVATLLSLKEAPDDYLWLPSLSLVSAKTLKEPNTKVIYLAASMQVLYLATRIHWAIPEDKDCLKLKEQIQYPILLGDLLYSRFYAIICRYELDQYLAYLATLIGNIHQEHVLRNEKRKLNLSEEPHVLRIYSLLGETACYLAAHLSAGKTYLYETIKQMGNHLGMLRGVWEEGYDPYPYLTKWYRAWELLEVLPPGPGRECFQAILLGLGRKWGLERPPVCKDLRA